MMEILIRPRAAQLYLQPLTVERRFGPHGFCTRDKLSLQKQPLPIKHTELRYEVSCVTLT